MTIYSIYNNKGGVGKTTLASNISTLYAEQNPNKQVLVIDLCPQANISHFLLGGGHKGYNNLQTLQKTSSRRNIVGFIDWLIQGNSNFTTTQGKKYAIKTNKYNKNMPDNLYLIAGDSFLESLSLALNFLVLNPADMNAWKNYMEAIRKLSHLEFNKKEYNELTVFIDTNPSFSIYTQMGILSSDYIIIPTMSDFTSLEGIKGLLRLIYGKYTSNAEEKYAENKVTFSSQVKKYGLSYPKIYSIIFNNYTIHKGVATAYKSIIEEIEDFIDKQRKISSELFDDNFKISHVKDFHTAGKVSSTLGIPIKKLVGKTKYIMPNGDKVNLQKKTYEESVVNIEELLKNIK